MSGSELGVWLPGQKWPGSTARMKPQTLYHVQTPQGTYTVIKSKTGAYSWRGLHPTDGHGETRASFRAATGLE